MSIIQDKKHTISYIGLLLSSFIIMLILLEVFLMCFPQILPIRLGNYIYSKYSFNKDGIYTYHEKSGLGIMKPNHSTQMYFNGLVWLHESDEIGFRNSKTTYSADIVLLGDSFVYGHGVNQHETISSFMEKETKLNVVNLGCQGYDTVAEYQALKYFGLPFKPKIVILFFYLNDIFDNSNYANEEELVYLIEEEDGFPYELEYPETLFEKKSLPKTISGILHDNFYSYRFFKYFLVKYLIKRELNVAYNWSDVESNKMRLAWEVNKKYLDKTRQLAKQNNVEFMIVYIHTEHHNFAEDFFREKIKDFSDKEGIFLLDLKPGFEDYIKRGGVPYHAVDGHFNQNGTYLASDLIAEDLRGKKWI